MGKLKIKIPDLKEFLDEKAFKYESPSFIKDDPILIPHQFTDKRDIEISAFITSIISWGNRKSIINSSRNIMSYMDHSPYDFIMNHTKEDLTSTNKSIHRTVCRSCVLGCRSWWFWGTLGAPGTYKTHDFEARPSDIENALRVWNRAFCLDRTTTSWRGIFVRRKNR